MVDSKKSKKTEGVSENKEKEDAQSGVAKSSTSIYINIEKTSSGSIVQHSKVFIETNKKIIESLSSSSLPSIRNSVRKTMYEALINKEEMDESRMILIKSKAIEIESTVHENLFKHDDRGSKYLSRVKAIASNLQDKKNPDFRTAVISGVYTSLDVTLMDVKKMASSELQNKRLMAEKDSFNSMRSDWHDVHAPVGIGMHTCEKCKSQRTTSKEIQLRGADEPMTLFIRCVDCGNEWRIG